MLSEYSDKIIFSPILSSMIEKELEKFGLDNKKAGVYLTVLELGEAKVYDIAKRVKLPRPTVYDILDKLSQMGLISFYEKRKVRYYIAENPEKFLILLENKANLFKHILPELRSRYNILEIKPKIHYYEGTDGIKTVLEDTLTASKKQLKSILSVVDLFEVPGRLYMDDYVKRRIEAGVRLKVIRSKPKEVGETWPTDTKALRELRYAPDNMVFSMTMFIYDNKVSLISSKKENFGMIIESKELAWNMNHLFEALWQVSGQA